MNYIRASGTCSVCGRYSEGVDNNPQCARLMLNHNHGHEYKHAFEGKTSTHILDRKEKT